MSRAISLEANITLVGPSLFAIGEVAGERIPGAGVADYLRCSIVEPYAFTVEGFGSSQMVGGWSELPTGRQIGSPVE